MNRKSYGIYLIWGLLTLTLLFNQIAAKTVKFSRKPRFQFEIKTLYDNNIFLYSEAYISDFKNQIRPYRFPFNTYDDFIVLLNPSIQLPLRIGQLKPNLYLNYKQYIYSVNAEKSYQIVSATINHPIINPIILEINYLLLPRYLIRYYRNPLGASTDYIGCSFSERLLTARLIYNIYNIKIKPFVRYEIDNYKENFVFYNSKALRFGVNATLTPYKFINVNVGLERKQNNAQGPVPDISDNENSTFIDIITKIPGFSKLSFNIGADYAHRIYTTSNSFNIDPYHKDRKDNKFVIYAGLTFRISKNLQIKTQYEQEIRKVTTPYQIDIEEIKDYSNKRFTLGFKFYPNIVFEGD